MFPSFLNFRTPQETNKTKRKWESNESVNEGEEGFPVTDNLQTPQRKRMCMQEQPEEENSTPFGKVTTWVKKTARRTARLFRSFADKYWPNGVDDNNTDDISPPVSLRPAMKSSRFEQGTSSHFREEQGGQSSSSSLGERTSGGVSLFRPTSLSSSHREVTLPGDSLTRRPLRGVSSFPHRRVPSPKGSFTRRPLGSALSSSVVHSRATSPVLTGIARRSLHDPATTRPRFYDPSKYDGNETRDQPTRNSWNFPSSYYREEAGHAGKQSPVDDRKTNPDFSDKPLVSKSLKNNHPGTVVDTVVRLQERQQYMKLLEHYTSVRQMSNGSCSVGTRSTEREAIGQSRTDFSTLRNRVHEQSLLTSSPLPDRHSECLEDEVPTVVRVQVSPSKIPSGTMDVSRGVSADVAKGVLELRTRTRRSKSSSKSIDIFEDGWIKKWKEALTAENIEKERNIAKEKLRLESLRKEKVENFQQISEEVKARMEGKRPVIEEKVDSFPELTSEMNCMVDKALGRGAPNEPLVETSFGRITRADIATLGEQKWLNDEIVNTYFQMLSGRSKKGGPKIHSFNTFFYSKLIKTGHSSLRRWTKKVDLFSMDIILVPVHLGMHWCLAVIDFKKKVISYYDSLKGENGQCLQALRDYLCAESLDKKKETFDLTGWKYDAPKNIPEQLNGCDCGVFICKYAEYISRRATFNFTQYNMPYFRRRMIYEILSKTLM